MKKDIKVQYVIKRDGQTEVYVREKPEEALSQAFKSTGYDYLPEMETLLERVETRLKEVTTVEEIQDVIVKVLMNSKYKDVATSFVKYRAERDQVREDKSSWAKMGIDITSGEDSESQRENSNVPRNSVTTQVEMIKRLYSKKFAMDFILPERFKKAHLSGEIHVHDLENLVTKTPNCCLMHYPYMLKNGFQLGNKWIEEPNTILTTMNILVQMVQVQSNLQFGGLTLQDLDVHLGKYILGSFRKYFIEAMEDLGWDGNDMTYIKNISKEYFHPENKELYIGFEKEVYIAKRKTEREVYRAAKLLSYQLNTLQIRGESSPFVTISYGLATTWEGRLLQECILQERLDEFDKSGVQEFPKNMMIIKEGVNLNKDDPNYDIFQLALKTSAKTCYPDYIFPDNQELHTGGSATYMG